jgi:hypothetical protein
MPVDVDYFNHPKTLRLMSILGRPEADVYPLRLWRWAVSYASDGQLPHDPRQIEVSIGWRGKPGRLYAALVEAGFIESDTFTLYSWMDHIGRAIAIYDEKKRKQRELYKIKVGILPEESRKNSPYPGYSGNPRYSGSPTATPSDALRAGSPDKNSFRPTKTQCANCGGTGKVAEGTDGNGSINLGRCRICS